MSPTFVVVHWLCWGANHRRTTHSARYAPASGGRLALQLLRNIAVGVDPFDGGVARTYVAPDPASRSDISTLPGRRVRADEMYGYDQAWRLEREFTGHVARLLMATCSTPSVMGPKHPPHKDVCKSQVRTVALKFERLGYIGARRSETIDHLTAVARRRTKVACVIR